MANVEIEQVATPPASDTVPIGVEPSKKVTEAVGVPAPGLDGETVAVKLTN
jgi:hypothetical protein